MSLPIMRSAKRNDATADRGPADRRWTPQQARAWHEAQPWLVGCNFIPSTAINQLEMWQPETFDPSGIDRELGWAASLGMNCVRVYLHDLLWRDTGSGRAYGDRIERYLQIADRHGIRTLLVIFDDCWLTDPIAGPQPEAVPARHNSGWVESPGWDRVAAFAQGSDAALAERLEGYVTDLLGRFADDERVLGWDLYNEPGGSARRDEGWPDRGWMRRRGEASLPLLTAVFDWAQRVRPRQPLTSGWWDMQYPQLWREQLRRSDILSFHCYGNVSITAGRVRFLEQHPEADRPVMLCTEYMARENDCTVATHLPWFKGRGIGAMNWGLVAGRTQTIYPWRSWEEDLRRETIGGEPDPWFHDLLGPNGEPYDPYEAELMRSLTSTG